MYNSQGQGGKVLLQNHLLFIMPKHIFQNTVYVTPLLFWHCFECYCFVKMSAIVEAQRWNLWCVNLRSSWWNLKTSHLRFSFCLYNLPFLFKNHLSLPLRSLPSKESLHSVLSLIQSFSSTLSSTELKIQANASCGERVDTVVGSSATVKISACLHCVLLCSVSEARVLVPKTCYLHAVSSRNLWEEVFL